MRYLLILALALVVPAAAIAQPHGVPPGQSKKQGVPPGLAKKGGLPPGLAKKYGAAPPARVYMAFDPARVDRAWFLIDGRWVLRRGFDAAVRVEVRDALSLPPVPPPVPLPTASVAFRVVLYE